MLEQPTLRTEVRLQTWQTLGQDYLVIGRVQPGGGDRSVAEFSAYDVLKGGPILEQRIPFSAADQRRTAHRIAEIIYRQLTGESAGFAAPVAFVTVSGSRAQDRKYVLQVADADGLDARSILSSREPIMSPAWSPDGTRLAYVSFENKRSAVIIQTLASGERINVSDRKGINGAPAWSPNGRELAMTLSKDGNPDLYVMEIESRALRRLTDHIGIDTEAAWSPDGRAIVFTSDRGGRPQLYRMPSSGGPAQRVTFEGDYNARGVYSPDGQHLAMVHGAGGTYRIAVMSLSTGSLKVLSRGPLDESPGFSPDGRRVLYSARVSGQAQLVAVALEGGREQVLRLGGAEVRQPAWSPKD
jgi:TolB protein